MIVDVAYGLLIAAGLGVVYFAWEVTLGNAKYRRWAKEGRKSTDD